MFKLFIFFFYRFASLSETNDEYSELYSIIREIIDSYVKSRISKERCIELFSCNHIVSSNIS